MIRFLNKNNNTKDYYNKCTQLYIDAGYGNIIQAHRPAEVTILMNHICNMTRIKNGIKILDAGCGVCGPAIYIANKFNVNIEAVSNSEVQIKIANENIENAELLGDINTNCYDYHYLDKIYPEEHFDLVIMLESYGHASDKEKLLKSAIKVLKKTGRIFIKDYFSKEITGSKARKSGLRKAIKRMNKAYAYNLADLNQTIKIFRKNDMNLELIQKNPLLVEDQDFVKKFEEINNIDLFGGGFHYLFLEPLELVFSKPADIDSPID